MQVPSWSFGFDIRFSNSRSVRQRIMPSTRWQVPGWGYVASFVSAFLALNLLFAGIADGAAAESYAIAMHGAPALPPDFTHMPYANPDAPKGGRLIWGLLGTFDSLNPMIVKGIPAVQQIRAFNFEEGYTVESLMARSAD